MNWNRYNISGSIPPENKPILVSDGDTITTAYYIMTDEHITWFFQNPGFKDMDIDWWQDLPKLPPKINKTPQEPIQLQ